jgi:hypothetical protein
MKDTPIFFTRSGSFTIQEFLNTKQENKMKVELIQKTTLTDMYYKIVVNGEFHMSYNDYDEAVRAYDRIKTAIPREEIILSKEI